jgi:hypothetical protein
MPSRVPVTPLGAIGRGVAAGAVGTGLMTAWQELSAKLQSSGDDAGGGQRPEPQDPWEQASVPAKAAKQVGEGVFGASIPADRIPLVTNVMHWSYGSLWGSVYGIAAGTARRSGPVRGALFGAFVWAMSYAQLVPMGLYEPPWKYPPKDLAMDLSYHLVYGAGVGSAYRVLDHA